MANILAGLQAMEAPESNRQYQTVDMKPLEQILQICKVCLFAFSVTVCCVLDMECGHAVGLPRMDYGPVMGSSECHINAYVSSNVGSFLIT